jgi:hypothetical protein
VHPPFEDEQVVAILAHTTLLAPHFSPTSDQHHYQHEKGLAILQVEERPRCQLVPVSQAE